MQLGFCLSESEYYSLTVFCHRISLVNQTPLLTKMVTGSWWMMMVTLHEPDFRSLEVTVLQTADRGIILCFLSPLSLKTNQLSTSYLVLMERIELSTSSLPRKCATTVPHQQNEFVSSCSIVIATIHPFNKLERDSVRHLGSVQSVTITDPCSSPQGGS